MNLRWSSFGWYGLIAIASFTAMVLAVGQFHLLSESFSGAGDQLFFQAQITMAGQTGPFGNNSHLNWQAGTNPWSQPQAGFFVLISAWLLSGMFGLPSMGAYILIFGIVGALNGIASLFLLRSVVGTKLSFLAFVLSFTIGGAGMFAILKLQHLNVAAFFLMPVLLGVLFRQWNRQSRPSWAVVTALAMFAAVSPLWWVFVAFIALVAFGPFLIWNRKKGSTRSFLIIMASAFLGGLVPVFFAFANSDKSAIQTRSGLDSNLYGGHLADFLAASPLLNRRFGFADAGVSLELSQVGMVGAIAAGCALLALLAVRFPRTEAGGSALLYAGTVIFFLTFLLGGIGNLQAAAAVLLGTESPARVWARLTIVIALIGACWFLIVVRTLVDRWQSRARVRKVTIAALGTLFLIMWAADYAVATPTRTAWSSPNLPEIAVTDYLKTHTTPCPVAQLPVDSTPISRVPWAQSYQTHDDFLYRGFLPYILAKDYFWTFGDSTSAKASSVSKLKEVVESEEFSALKAAGFCAVLYDKKLAQFVSDNQVSLPGREIDTTDAPTFENERYELFIL